MESALNITNASAPGYTTVGGIVPIKSMKQLQEEERAAAITANSSTVIQNLAAYIKGKWMYARMAKEYTVEQQMLKSVRARRGQYDPDKLAQLREQGSSTIFMMLTSNKCRAASSWLRDVVMSSPDEKPWSLKPSPIPDMQPDILADLMMQAQQQLEMLLAQGMNPTDVEVRELLLKLKDAAYRQLGEIAEDTAMRMEKKMHQQMIEGNWTTALAQFIDDLVTFPSAVLKGPVVRNRPELKWVKDLNGQYELEVKQTLALEWERVSPFNVYPAPDASTVHDGYLIERHKLSRADLHELIGVDGYSDGAIRGVLEQYGKGGLREWIYVDLTKATAEGKSTTAAGQNPSELIDALQFWGSVQGRLLLDWGMSEEEVPDPMAEYPIEAWLIGTWIIKAVINSDPLGRKPYYKTSYEEVPGAYWGNSVADLCRDTQDVCNAAARSLVNNMSLASGPQVVYNVDRLPEGENVTQLYPWKIWQVTADPLGSGSKPVEFYQPSTQAQELMTVYEKFAVLADEYTGIPRYMTGGTATGGAARTASGMSMLMTNAGKSIKQVIANMDEHVIKPCIERLYYYNMRYSDDPDLKGDVDIVARGASSILEKEQAQQRRNEFLQITLNSPVAQQVVGMEGIAELLRQAAGTLDMNVDKIIPSPEQMKIKEAQAQAMQQAQQQAELAQQQQGLAVQFERGPDGAVTGARMGNGGTPANPTDQRQLMNGAPTTDLFSQQG